MTMKYDKIYDDPHLEVPKGQNIGTNKFLFKGLYLVSAKNIVTGEKTGFENKVRLLRLLGGEYSDMYNFSNAMTAYFRGHVKYFSFKNGHYILEFKEDEKAKRNE